MTPTRIYSTPSVHLSTGSEPTDMSLTIEASSIRVKCTESPDMGFDMTSITNAVVETAWRQHSVSSNQQGG